MKYLIAGLLIICPIVQAREMEKRSGDWMVTGRETVKGKHIRLDGSLILEPGAHLTLDDCQVDILGSKSREHHVAWGKDSVLVTNNTTIGGFENEEGKAIHTVFHLYAGSWDATDTVVQYSYGISFGHETGGRLTAKRLIAGPRPDAIIASGTADISLTDCEFPIAVSVYADKGGDARFNLPVKTPVTRIFEAGNTPGIHYRMELKNTVVPDHWFLFIRNTRDAKDAPECTITLGDCPKLIVSLLGHDVTGELSLSTDLARPVNYGNVRISRAGDPVNVFVWALYASGDKTDVTVHGPARICELMHRGGKMRLRGTPGGNDLMVGCTTLEVGKNAVLDLENVHLGDMWGGTDNHGEANVADNAMLTGRKVSVSNVTFHTEGEGIVNLSAIEKRGEIKERANGGEILLKTAAAKNNPLQLDGRPFYGADPSGIIVSDGRLFLFPTTDNRDWEEQFGWSCYSSTDLIDWKNHGVIFSAEDSAWGENRAWAPDITERDGRFYLYYYFNNGKGAKVKGVGVAVADKPEGPFKELSVDKPLVSGHDPAVFADDDGRYWLYLQDKVYELSDDMASLKSGPIDLNLEYRPEKFEAAYVFKRDGVYYFTIARDWNNLIYYSGKSPTGPFEFRGEFFKEYGGNNHHSIVKYRNQWVIFYHEWLKNDPVHQRQIRAEYLHFNPDGSIQMVEPTEEGVSFLGGE